MTNLKKQQQTLVLWPHRQLCSTLKISLICNQDPDTSWGGKYPLLGGFISWKFLKLIYPWHVSQFSSCGRNQILSQLKGFEYGWSDGIAKGELRWTGGYRSGNCVYLAKNDIITVLEKKLLSAAFSLITWGCHSRYLWMFGLNFQRISVSSQNLTTDFSLGRWICKLLHCNGSINLPSILFLLLHF